MGAPQAEDPIERLIGPFGLYQWVLLIILAIGRLPTEFQLNNVVFVIPSVEYICLDEGANNATNICPCENPLYDETAILSSVTSEWNLICDRGSLASLAQSILQAGILFGSLFYGYVADRYGRRPAILLSMLLEIIFIVSSAVIPELWLFVIFRFLIGTSVGGVIVCVYVLIIELTGTSFRPYMTALQELPVVTGYFTLPMIAYAVRYWRQLLLVTSVPWAITALLYFVLPESPRWLITKGRTEDAVQLLTKIAKINKRPTENIRAIVNEMCEESLQSKQPQTTYFDLFKTPKIRKNTILVALLWICTISVYYGFNQYIGRLEGNLYLNVIIASGSHYIGLIYVVIATLYFKRRISLITSYTTAALFMILFLFTPYSMYGLYLTFAIIGLVCAYTTMVQIYLFSSELFPTVVRNSALGIASMAGRFGGFAAPFIVNIGVETVSLLMFSGIAIFAAVVCCFLPETRKIVLLNTINDLEKDTKPEKPKLEK